MNCYGGKHLAQSFRTVRGNTLKIAEEIPEDQYGFRPAPDTRTVAELLAHIALGHRFQQQMHQVERRTTIQGFDFPTFIQQVTLEEQKLRTKDEIIDGLRREGEAWAAWLESLSDSFLEEQVTSMPGTQPPVRSRLEMLLSPKEHEMHHRGQLMLVERMLGITPHLTRQMQERMAARNAQQSARPS